MIIICGLSVLLSSELEVLITGTAIGEKRTSGSSKSLSLKLILKKSQNCIALNGWISNSFSEISVP